MMNARADRTPRSPSSRDDARRAPVRPKGIFRPASSAAPVSVAIEPAKVAVAADVMAILAAFGLED